MPSSTWSGIIALTRRKGPAVVATRCLQDKPRRDLRLSVLIPALFARRAGGHQGNLDDVPHWQLLIPQNRGELIAENQRLSPKKRISRSAAAPRALLPCARFIGALQKRTSRHLISVRRDQADEAQLFMLAQPSRKRHRNPDTPAHRLLVSREILQDSPRKETKTQSSFISPMPPFALAQARTVCSGARSLPSARKTASSSALEPHPDEPEQTQSGRFGNAKPTAKRQHSHQALQSRSRSGSRTPTSIPQCAL